MDDGTVIGVHRFRVHRSGFPNFDGFVKSARIVMPVPDQVRDDGSGIQNPSKLLDSGFRRNDAGTSKFTFYEFVNFDFQKISARPGAT
jgi:hypothetical protein